MMSITDQLRSCCEDEVDDLITRLMPTSLSNKKRAAISQYMIDLIKPNFPSCLMFGSGSSILKTYLPESDIDLVFFTTDNNNDDNDKDDSSKASSDSNNIDDTKSIFRILNALCDEIIAKDSGTSISSDMTIRNVEFINARTKVVHCFVNNINIDITINQLGAVAAATFLEEADRLIGYDHLFKKSLILIKCWCLNESIKYCGNPILGAKQGMFSSYAISVLVLHLFNQYSSSLTHPFNVLRAFLSTYSSFRWENFILSIDGPIAITSNTTMKLSSSSSSTKTDKVFESLITQFQNLMNKSKYKKKACSDFPIRCCCIVDPLDSSNNLGISISRQNLNIISQALKNGYHHLETILAWNHEQKNRMNVLVNIFFPASYDLYISGGNVRCDLRDHPLQKYTTFEKTVVVASDAMNSNDNDTNDVLQTNILSIWTTLTQVVLALDTKDDDTTREKGGAASPPSVAATYALSSSIFSPGSSDEGNTINDDAISYKYNGIDESKINNDALCDDVSPLKIETFDYTRPQSPRASSFLLNDYDHDTKAIWEGITSPTAQYLMSKSFKAHGIDKEMQTDDLSDSIAIDDSKTELATNSIVGDSNSTNITSKTTSITKDCTTINLNDCSTSINTAAPKANNNQKKKSKNNKALNTVGVSSNSNNSTTGNALSKNIDSRGSSTVAATDSSLKELLRKVKPIILSIRPVVPILCAIVIGLASIAIYWCAAQNEISMSEMRDKATPRDFRRRSTNYWIIKGNSMSFGELSYVESLSAILAQENNSTVAESLVQSSLFQWRKDGLNLTNPSKDTTMYTIHESKESDAGIYNLVAVGGSAGGIVLAEIKISMSIPPSVKSKPKYFNEKRRGEGLRIELFGEGMPPPSYQWYRNGVQLAGKVTNILVLENISKSDSGTYSCELVNIAGKHLFQEVIVVVGD